jgi:hypothetical protein
LAHGFQGLVHHGGAEQFISHRLRSREKHTEIEAERERGQGQDIPKKPSLLTYFL